jgi:tetratricopeptide (TPR) repeat protein
MVMELNAVERRLVDIQNHWQDFLADDSKRLLLWQIKESSTRLMEAFFEAQQHEAVQEKPYGCSDTFVVFDVPFDNSISYSRTLKEALAGQYEASQDAFKQVGRQADWKFTTESQPDSALGFIQGLNSLARHHQEVLGRLVAVILPTSVANESHWVAWLGRALQAAPDKGVCLVVIDSLENPRCSALVESGQPQLQVATVPIDAIELAGETFAQEPAVGAAGVFRSLLTGLLGLVEKGAPEQVMVKANDAIEFARKQGWLDQEVVVRMMAAGSMLKAGRFDEAVTHYRHARTTAEKVIASGHPAGRDLVLQSWFGEASAHFAAENLPEAIRCYSAATPVAQAIPKPILWIESLRMAAFCHRRNRDDKAAAQCCEQALRVGERLPQESRGMTTLPLVALESLRLLDAGCTERIEAVKQRLDRDLVKLSEELEREVVKLEGQPGDGGGLKELEQALAEQSDRLKQTAAREINSLTTSGTKYYSEALERIRLLLWPGWPLDPPDQDAPATERPV